MLSPRIARPATFFGTTITDGEAIAPGPALTIRDRGPFVTFPLTSIGAKTGAFALSEYGAGTLGGTPSGIQVPCLEQRQWTAACRLHTACSRQSADQDRPPGSEVVGLLGPIPDGGPYFVSVHAANSSIACSRRCRTQH